MSRIIYFIFILFFIAFSIQAKDKPITYQLKGNISDAEKGIYENWVQSVLEAFNGVGPGKKVEFTPIINIQAKKNSWPTQFHFYDEVFFSCQPLKHSKDTINFNPIKEITSLGNNEFAFKQLIANYLICNHFAKEIPFWFEKGLSSYLANKAGPKSWTERNYAFLLFLANEKNEIKTIEQILNFKNKFDNKDRYLQEAYSWALVNWLMQQKEYLDSPNLILAFSNPKNTKSVTDLKNLNESWKTFIDTNFWSHLPKTIKVTSECQTILEEEDLRGLFFTIKKKYPIISAEHIAIMLGATIHPQTLANIKTLVKDIRPVVRELAAKTLGIIPDRTSIPLLIEASYADISEPVRLESAKSISQLNYQLAPKALVDSLALEDPVSVGQVALALANIGDPGPAKNLVQKLGSIRPTTNYIAITETRNYVSDYNVVDGVYDPVISTCTEGIVSEVTILWVVELRANIMKALNKMPLNKQGQTEDIWYNWYKNQ